MHETTAVEIPDEGELPRELYGAVVRNGPNPVHPPANLYHWFDGDGMLHAVQLRDGRADYHGGRLLALWYLCGTRWAVDPPTLEPRGDGPFGVGWQLRLPEIRRAARFGVPAYDDAVDRFELAGELLVAATGGRFHPLTETLPARPEARGRLVGGDRDRRHGRALRHERQHAHQPRSGHEPDRALAARRDRGREREPDPLRLERARRPRHGLPRHGDAEPSRGLAGRRRAQGAFVYETRPDPIHAFPAGVETTLTKRVKEIVVTVGGSALNRPGIAGGFGLD